MTRLKNFRSDSISAQTRVVAGSMKPPNTSVVMGGPVRVASMVAATGDAAAAPARRIDRMNDANHGPRRCMWPLRYLPSSSCAAFARKM